jgi:hypothetical protein
MNDGAVYEFQTAHCFREENGWVEGSSGNGTGGFLPTGEGIGTVVTWEEAPAWAAAARYRLLDCEQVVPVEQGFVLAAFDDVAEDGWSDPFQMWPRLASWIDASGVERAPDQSQL